ncbi:MAG: helix-turn-helix domain-containing protein [Verrucomicrobiae bacterium]|nr:helix-turn-helix domain-containing protein [Verrucomicrobiae bacterium]
MKKGATVHLTPALSPARRGSEPVVASEGYLDKVAVAKRLGVKPKTVGEWANQGRLPAYRLGPYLRFKWAEVEAHLAATCRVTSPFAAMPRGLLGDC